MAKIFYVLQMRIEKAHQLDNHLCVTLPFFPVLQRQKIFDHLLDMPAVFTHYKVIPRGIIFHTLDLRKQIYMKKPSLQTPQKEKPPVEASRRIIGFYGFSEEMLIDKNLAYIAMFVGEVGRPQEIKPFHRLGIEIQPDRAAACQRHRFFLYDLSRRPYELYQEPACLGAVELYLETIRGGVGEGLVADGIRLTGGSGIYDKDGRIAYFSERILLFDPEIELAQMRRIRVVLILVLCRSTCCRSVAFCLSDGIETFAVCTDLDFILGIGLLVCG